MFLRINRLILLAVLLFAGAITQSPAQQGAWQKIAPAGEAFTVLMPTMVVEASRLIPFSDQDSVRERVYYSLAGSRRYMIVSFMKTTPERALPLSSFERFMLGIEQSFKSKDEHKSLIFDREVSVNGLSGRQYHIKLAEYPGVGLFLEKDKAFYALMVIGAEEGDPDVQRFLSSFTPGEANPTSEHSGVIVDIPANSTELERIRTALPPEPWPRTAGPIIGGVINGKAISLPTPKYPKEARKNHDSGQVVVQVIIDEQGTVVAATAVSGPDTLQPAAVGAARMARFTPTRLMGQPVKITGVIIYNFVAY